MSEQEQPTSEPDLLLVERLRAGDQAAFTELVERYHGALVRLAMAHVRTRDVAEDVAQDTWLGVLNGLDRFEGRSSLKTWIFRIRMNRAITRGEREWRSIPFSSLAADDGEDDAPAVDPDRFRPADDRWPGHWATPPHPWDEIPERRLLARETLERISEAIGTLPPTQRRVITLRDVEGWDPIEVCNLLAISETNQRVLLHRARSKVRAALERYLGNDEHDDEHDDELDA